MVRFSPSETLPTRFLGSMGSPNPFSPSQPLPTPLLRKIQSSILPMNLQTHGKEQTTKNKFANPKVKKYQRVRSCPATVLVLLALQNSLSKRLNLKLFLGWVRATRGPPFYTKNWLSKRLNLKLFFWLGSRAPGAFILYPRIARKPKTAPCSELGTSKRLRLVKGMPRPKTSLQALGWEKWRSITKPCKQRCFEAFLWPH